MEVSGQAPDSLAVTHALLLNTWWRIRERLGSLEFESCPMVFALARLVYAISSCARLWLLARIMGVSIAFREMLRMHFQKIDVAEVVRVLVEARAAGLAVSPADVEQAYLQGVDLQKVILAMIEARRQGMSFKFQEIVEAAQSLDS